MKLSLLFAMVLTASTAHAGKAADHIKPYGDLLLFFGAHNANTYDVGGQQVKDLDLLYNINQFSHLGANVGYREYSGSFELGLGGADQDHRVIVRKAYGEVKGKKWSMLLGKDWAPYVAFSSEMADYHRSMGFGAMYQDTALQIRINYLGFHAAFLKPHVPVRHGFREQEVSSPTVSAGATEEYDLVPVDREITTGLPLESVQSYVPTAVLGYEFENKQLRLRLGGAINSYILDEVDYVEFNKKWMYSYLAYLNADIKLDTVTLRLSGGFTVNPTNFGITTQSRGNTTYAGGAAVALENIATGQFEIKDVWNAQAYAEIGYKLNRDTVIHAGYGFSHTQYPTEGTVADQAMEYYLNARFEVGGMLAIIPAFSLRDYMDDMSGEQEGYELYGGLLASIAFNQ